MSIKHEARLEGSDIGAAFQPDTVIRIPASPALAGLTTALALLLFRAPLTAGTTLRLLAGLLAP